MVTWILVLDFPSMNKLPAIEILIICTAYKNRKFTEDCKKFIFLMVIKTIFAHFIVLVCNPNTISFMGLNFSLHSKTICRLEFLKLVLSSSRHMLEKKVKQKLLRPFALIRKFKGAFWFLLLQKCFWHKAVKAGQKRFPMLWIKCVNQPTIERCQITYKEKLFLT